MSQSYKSYWVDALISACHLSRRQDNRWRRHQTVADVRAVDMTPDQGAEIARRVIGWPILSDKPTPRQRADQSELDADLVMRRDRYFGELGANAYAAFNLVTDFASHPPQSNRLRRNRPTLERMAGAWLRGFRAAAKRPGFTVARHIEELAGGETSVVQAGSIRRSRG